MSSKVGILLGGSTLLVAAILWTGGDPHRFALLLGGLYFAVFAAIAAVRIFRNGRMDMITPAVPVLAYFALGIGLRGVTNLALAESRLDKVLDPTSADYDRLMIRVFAAAFLGTAFYLLGDALGRRACSGRFRFKEPLLSEHGTSLALLVGLIFFLAGGGPLLVRLGIETFLNPGENAVEGVAGYFWAFPMMFGGIYGIVLSIAHRWSKGEAAGLPRILLLALVSIAIYLGTSSKAALIVPALMLLVIHHLIMGRISLKVLLISPLTFLLMLPFLYSYRAFGLRALFVDWHDINPISSGWKLFFARSYMVDSLAAVLHYTPSVFPYQHGKSWLEILFFWIPRGLWPGKPFSQGFLFGQTYFSSSPLSGESFFAVSWFGDAYLNFGIWGLPVILLLIGFGLRYVYEFLGGSHFGTGGAFLFAAAFYHVAIGAEQSLSGFLTLLISYVAVASILLLIASRFSGPVGGPRMGEAA